VWIILSISYLEKSNASKKVTNCGTVYLTVCLWWMRHRRNQFQNVIKQLTDYLQDTKY
jgi:hypothetical protein